MKHFKLFEEFVSELKQTSVSGTKSGWITSLEDRKYQLKKDVKGAQIGDFVNVVLPKGTIIYNLPGGVFADHVSLKNKYSSKSSNGPQWFDKPTFNGIQIRQKPDILKDIEKNAKVLESVNEAKTLDRDAMMTWFKGKGRDFVKTSKEFSKDNEDTGIWLSKSDDDKHFDYYSRGAKYNNGILKTFKKQAADRGWDITYYDPSTIMVWPSTNESVNEGKSYQEKFKEESDHYQEMINDPKKRVYDIVDFAQFTTGGMTQRQWEMFMIGRYKKFKDNTDKPTKEKMYKVLTKWLGES